MYLKLKQHLIEIGMKNKELSELTGISESSLSRKINGKGIDFNLNEVRTLCEKLKIDPNLYFFSSPCCSNDNKKDLWSFRFRLRRKRGNLNEFD